MSGTLPLIAIDKNVVVEIRPADELVYPKFSAERKVEIVEATKEAMFDNALATNAGLMTMKDGLARHLRLKRGLEILG